MSVRTPDDAYPKVLVVSSNPFSKVSNNGKTLSSFFRDYPQEKIAQLYFSNEQPDSDRCSNFFKISDYDVLGSLLSLKTKECGGKVHSCQTWRFPRDEQLQFPLGSLRKSYLARLVRELLWATRIWKGSHFIRWLDDFSPDIIFLCGGGSGFAYDIVQYIRKRYEAKLVLFITDDYIMPRKLASPFFWIRRRYIVRRMSNAINSCDLFITISEQMRREYHMLFGKDSSVMMNMTDSMKAESEYCGNPSCIDLIYAGGLHYNRFKTLNLLAKALKKYNGEANNRTKAFLKIYCTRYPNRSIQKYLDVEGASRYCGSLNPSELREALNASDITVHVEAFDRKSIESTRLSISTKIPEYLSLAKPILAIGPPNVASIEYLKDCAFCITDTATIYPKLRSFLNDSDLRGRLSVLASARYQENHNSDITTNEFRLKLLQLHRI